MSRALSYLARTTALLLTTLSCSRTTAPEGCAQNVQVAVSTGAGPIFSWSPACGISSLAVVTVPAAPGVSGSGESMWAFSVPEQRPIGPAVLYGTAPADATVSTQPRALVVGTTYRVSVMQTLGGDGVVGSGERVFTR
jgi:hypothetical protein